MILVIQSSKNHFIYYYVINQTLALLFILVIRCSIKKIK
ncbi:conserved hypothetical protein [Xenorhabdus nematophila F1]|nr:conserved hypothetical protein [Xenorhabdus nematophila F1]